MGIFSRHLEDMTSKVWHTSLRDLVPLTCTKYPDVVATMKHLFEASKLESVILDSEIVAIDPNTGALKSFQDLSGRARKNVNVENIDIPVSVFAFDIMYLNGAVSAIVQS